MSNGFSLLWLVLGMTCVVEALPWLIAPQRMRNLALSLAVWPEQLLRYLGLGGFGLGLLLAWLGRELSQGSLSANFNEPLLLLVLGLVLVLESLPWLLAPKAARLSQQLLAITQPDRLRLLCGGLLLLGLVLLWLGK